MKKYLFFTILFTLLFSACSTKEVYEPIKLDTPWKKFETTKSAIIDTSSNVALLEDRTVLTRDGNYDIKVKENERVISSSDGWLISASIDGNITLTSQSNATIVKNLELKKTVAGASVDGDEIAILFADNEIAIYDINSNSVLFKEQGSKYIATDSRIVNPYFMKGLILFSTLDGKVIIVNGKLKKRLRTIIVSSEENFNNIISIDLIENKIIAATSYELLAMAKKELRAKYEIRNILFDEDRIYIATKQGEVLSLTSNLEVISKVKFPFAHFYGMVSKNGKLYILEKEGYMLVVDQTTFDYTVHEFTLQSLTEHLNSQEYNKFLQSNNFSPAAITLSLDDAYIFVTKEDFYINDKKILVE